MAAAPSYVAVKRRRDGAPIQSLILEERQTDHLRLNVEYKLESISQSSNLPPPRAKAAHRKSASHSQQNSLTTNDEQEPLGKRPRPSGPRHFELTTGKRSAEVAGLLPTFIERPLKRAFTENGPRPAPTQTGTPLKRPGTRSTITRPGKENGGNDRSQENTEESAESTALAASLHSFALEEAARDERGPQQEESEEEVKHFKPRVIVQPKRPIRRKKEAVPSTSPAVEPRNGAAQDEDGDDYVYDIYIRSSTNEKPQAPPVFSRRAPAVPAQSAKPVEGRSPLLMPLEGDSTAPRSLLNTPFPNILKPDFSSMLNDISDSNVGFLHLPTSETEASYFWTSDRRTQLNGASSSDEHDDEDDEDSNAEDYYGADYPEDEVDGDDEMGVDAYRFRRGSEGEDDFADPGWAGRGTWTGRDGAEQMWSDDEDEHERSVGAMSGARPMGTRWVRGIGEVKDDEDKMEE